jgi:two-component system, LytTR family, sensor kinase
MASSSSGRRDRLLWTVVALSAALTVLTLVASRYAAGPPVVHGMRGLPRIPRPPVSTAELLRSLGVGSLIWYACFLSAPLLVAMSRRFPFDRRRWRSSVAAHLVVLVLLVAITSWLQYRLTYRGAPMAPPVLEYLQVAAIASVLPFLTVTAAAHALDARARAHERELDAQRMRRQLAESRLDALTAQLQPHFLFNTIQGISALIHQDPSAADAMLASLSDLLRDVLRRASAHEVTLCEEIRVLQSYLDISRRRFGDRLTINVDVDDSTTQALVPFFILQPLVENALHHGVSSQAGPAKVDIAARRTSDRLELSVTDDGRGTVLPDAGRGIGLANTKARLDELYGETYTLETRRLDDAHVGNGAKSVHGFRVCLAIPFREGAHAEDAS